MGDPTRGKSTDARLPVERESVRTERVFTVVREVRGRGTVRTHPGLHEGSQVDGV